MPQSRYQTLLRRGLIRCLSGSNGQNALGGGAFVAFRMKKFIDPCQMKCLHKKSFHVKKYDMRNNCPMKNIVNPRKLS